MGRYRFLGFNTEVSAGVSGEIETTAATGSATLGRKGISRAIVAAARSIASSRTATRSGGGGLNSFGREEPQEMRKEIKRSWTLSSEPRVTLSLSSFRAKRQRSRGGASHSPRRVAPCAFMRRAVAVIVYFGRRMAAEDWVMLLSPGVPDFFSDIECFCFQCALRPLADELVRAFGYEVVGDGMYLQRIEVTPQTLRVVQYKGCEWSCVLPVTV